MKRSIYIRPHRALTYGTAEDEARKAGVSVSEYICEALREKIQRETGEDTGVDPALFRRRRRV